MGLTEILSEPKAGAEGLKRNILLANRVYANIFRQDGFSKERLAYLSFYYPGQNLNGENLAIWLDEMAQEEGGILGNRFGRRILLVAGLIQPLTALDWTVDRTEEADKKMGIKPGGLKILQTSVGNFRGGGSHTHLHKGPGDGKYMRKIGQETAKDGWEQKGVADKYYTTLERILEKHIKAEAHDDDFFQKAIKPLFFQVIRRTLQKRWYSGRKWDREECARTHFCNPNDLHVIDADDLRNTLEELVKDDFFLNKALMFEDEGKERMAYELYAWVLKMLGKDLETIRKELASGRRKGIIKGEITVLRGQKVRLQQIRGALTKQKDEVVFDGASAEVIEICGEEEVSKVRNLPDLIRCIDKTIGNLVKRIGELGKETSHKLGNISCKEYPFLEEFYRMKDFTIQYFDESIFSTIRGASGNVARDLILDIETDTFCHIDLGYFEEIPELYGKNTLDLISATRSDSHEDDKQFERDIRGCIDALKPGGVMITDGCYASYSEIQRYDIIQEIARERPDLQVFVVYHKTNKRPKSIIIQKGIPTLELPPRAQWRFFKKNKLGDQILDSKHELIEIGQVTKDPVMRVTNEVRRRLLALAGGNKGVFGPLRYEVPKVFDVLMRDEGRIRLKKLQWRPGGRIHWPYDEALGFLGDHLLCMRVMENLPEDHRKKILSLTQSFGGKKISRQDLETEVNKEFDETTTRMLVKRYPGFFFMACSRHWDDVLDEERSQFFLQRNEGCFRESLSYEEAIRFLSVIDKMKVADADILKLFLGNNGTVNEKNIHPLIARYSTQKEATEYIYWIRLRRDFFYRYINQAQRGAGVTKKTLSNFTENVLLEWFFQVNRDARERLEMSSFQHGKHQNLGGIVEATCIKVAAKLRRFRDNRREGRPLILQDLPRCIDHILAPIYPGSSHTFPARGAKRDDKTNRHYESKKGSPNNMHIGEDVVSGDRDILSQNLGTLKMMNPTPILVVEVGDCLTNPWLVKQLENICTSENVTTVKCNDANAIEATKSAIYEHSRKGGIVVISGSHEDAFSEFGKAFSEKVIGNLSRLTQENKKLGVFATCFGYQTLAQGLGIGETREGMLEFGSYGIKSNHETLNGFGQEFSAALSHTGHVILDTEKMDNSGYEILGTNSLTGQPVGFIGKDRRVVAVQYHTELPTNQPARVLEFIQSFKREEWMAIRGKFGVGQDRVTANFETARHPQTDKIIAPYDIGPLLMTRFLRVISDQIISKVP